MTEMMVKAAGGTRGLPMHLKKKKKKNTRLRKARANRRWVAYSGLDGLERAIACRLEHLEMTNYDDDKAQNGDEDDDEYDLDNDRLDGPLKKKSKRTRRSTSKDKDRKLQRFTSLEQVLLQIHANKSEGRCPRYVSASTRPVRTPDRHFCAVTGHVAKYKDPQSGLRYSSQRAFRVLKEHPPPWVNGTGNAMFMDAMKMIRDDIKKLSN